MPAFNVNRDHHWFAFSVVTLSVFGYLERRALQNGTPTLSHWIRYQIGVYPLNRNREFLRVWFAASLAWLFWHLLKGENND